MTTLNIASPQASPWLISLAASAGGLQATSKVLARRMETAAWCTCFQHAVCACSAPAVTIETTREQPAMLFNGWSFSAHGEISPSVPQQGANRHTYL